MASEKIKYVDLIKANKKRWQEDEEYRKELFCQIAVILDEELPCIPLFVAEEAVGYNLRVKGVKNNGNDMITWNIADWKVVE